MTEFFIATIIVSHCVTDVNKDSSDYHCHDTDVESWILKDMLLV